MVLLLVLLLILRRRHDLLGHIHRDIGAELEPHDLLRSPLIQPTLVPPVSGHASVGCSIEIDPPTRHQIGHVGTETVVIRQDRPHFHGRAVDRDFPADATGVRGGAVDADGDEFAFFAGGGGFEKRSSASGRDDEVRDEEDEEKEEEEGEFFVVMMESLLRLVVAFSFVLLHRRFMVVGVTKT
ncbi:hypothetical protein ACHAXS_007360 [Conticribra weissflogii]